MPISRNQWRWTAGAFHSAIVASPIWQDHNDDPSTVTFADASSSAKRLALFSRVVTHDLELL